MSVKIHPWLTWGIYWDQWFRQGGTCCKEEKCESKGKVSEAKATPRSKRWGMVNTWAGKAHPRRALAPLLCFSLWISALDSSVQLRLRRGNRKRKTISGFWSGALLQISIWSPRLFTLVGYIYFVYIWCQNRKSENVQHSLVCTVKLEEKLTTNNNGEQSRFQRICTKIHYYYYHHYFRQHYWTNYAYVIGYIHILNNKMKFCF